MRLVTTMNAPKPGGAEIYSATLAEQLAAYGWDVHILTPPLGPSTRLARNRGLRVHRALLGICAVRARGLGAVAAFDPFHFLLFGFYLWRLTADKRAVLLLQDPTQQLWGTFWGALLGVPVVLITHSPFHFRPMRILLTRLFARAVGAARLTITVSEDHRRKLIALGVPPERVVSVPVGRDPRRFKSLVTPEVVQRLPAGSLAIGCFSRLQPGKGIDVAIHALRALRSDHNIPAELLIAGTGSAEARLRHLVTELGVNAHVHFLGHRHDVPELMRSCYAVLLPSSDRGESLPAVVVEAMFAGACVVASRAGGTAEVIDDGRTGVLVDQVSGRAFAAAVAALLADPAQRQRLASQARLYADRYLTLDNMVTTISRLITEAAGRSEQRTR